MKEPYFTQLILNPVENLPSLLSEDSQPILKGLYVSDKYKTDDTIKESIIGFSGRETYNKSILNIYDMWAKKLNVSKISMRLLSGLHAHIILFMGLGHIGDTVLLLPEEAGGHFATKKILVRLGYQVIEMVTDCKNRCVDTVSTRQLIDRYKPEFIFVDRSEGINFEDFTALLTGVSHKCCSIFDASQYLTNILTGEFPSPFDMGFDIMMSSLHKNFPGPQKAMVCSKNDNEYWQRIATAMSDYVSNLHADNIFMAGDILKHDELLQKYSKSMLVNSTTLESELALRGLPIVNKNHNQLPSHHIWIKPNSKEASYKFYKDMEECELLVNYRQLPYKLGYGIRMGTSAATLQGLNESNIIELADIIGEIYNSHSVEKSTRENATNFISLLTPLTLTAF